MISRSVQHCPYSCFHKHLLSIPLASLNLESISSSSIVILLNRFDGRECAYFLAISFAP